MKRKPGKPVPDAQRRTTRVTVHLPPDVAAELRRRGVGHPRGASGVIEALISALKAAEAAAWNSPTAKNRRRVLNYRRALARRPVTVVPSSGARW